MREAIHSIHRLAALIPAFVFFGAVAAVISCAPDPTIYGAHNDTERSVCAAEGLPATTSLSHGGYVTSCSLPE